ncbi:MAG: rod shape-determining protein MreC [Lachnospiraceae bacterium]|nr:rod shape-determining protein MreC [Lachnospiraceae bacterium]
MARNRSKRSRIIIPSKYILLGFTLLCIGMMAVSYTTDIMNGPLEAIAGYTIVPFQKGISKAGYWLTSRSDSIKHMQELTEENEELKNTVADLTLQINDLQQDKFELSELRQLYALDERYDSYEKIGARVIGKDAGNWFSFFLIDKGRNDGIDIDMNVIAGGGLVGVVTDVGPNWASVRSIIDDSANVSGMVLSTSDLCIVSGDLELMNDGYIQFSQLIDEKDIVGQGDQIVTSYISDKYLPGISIGYISHINRDANNMTKSGYITPVVDFKHMETVLVILEKKKQKDS